MSTIFYLKKSIMPCPGKVAKSILVHPRTQLKVERDLYGSYVFTHEDPYEDLNMTPPGTDLLDDVDTISTKFMVDVDPATDQLKEGEYRCEVGGVRIAVDKVSWRAGKKTDDPSIKYRNFTVVATKWEDILAAVEKVRQGEITHVAEELTIYQKLQSEKSHLTTMTQQMRERVTSLDSRLRNEQDRSARCIQIMGNVADYLSGETDQLISTSGLNDERIEVFARLESTAYEAKRTIDALKRLKSTWWYCTCKFLHDLPSSLRWN